MQLDTIGDFIKVIQANVRQQKQIFLIFAVKNFVIKVEELSIRFG
ncbi:hypothetical protein GXM_06261 [Nostoc sphaeroides CCNUC1]|uniref:Uncharacterized protein n=1 Tax=Nostoc sphaeroides CCNUC1 TaxID=2653204 RepID=A0A5P8W7L7_9NOSO|nr:hypothetical protein GXM_06261 [Nostoc sphaeroides CCNUC1]